jgi:hypothetical protein
MKHLYTFLSIIVFSLIVEHCYAQGKPFKVQVKINYLYSNAWDDSNNDIRHSWYLRANVDERNQQERCYSIKNDTRPYTFNPDYPDNLLINQEYDQLPSYINLYFEGYEDNVGYGCPAGPSDHDRNNAPDPCKPGNLKYILNFKANQDTIITVGCSDNPYFKGGFSLYYSIPAPKDTSFTIENIGGSSSTKFCKEADTIKLSIPTAQPYNK